MITNRRDMAEKLLIAYNIKLRSDLFDTLIDLFLEQIVDFTTRGDLYNVLHTAFHLVFTSYPSQFV